MFPEPSFPLQNAAPTSAFWAVSELGPRWGPPELAMGELLGPATRRHFSANSCFAMKDNMFGVGFQLRRPPAKQQGPGSPRQPRLSLAYGVQRSRGEKGKRCFAEQRRIGAVVCSPRRVYLSGMQLPEWSLERSMRGGLGAELPSWLRADCWVLRQEGICLPSPACPRRRTL